MKRRFIEGFLTELLKEEITILEVLESEGNKENKQDKFNRVDLKVKNDKEELIIQHSSISSKQVRYI